MTFNIRSGAGWFRLWVFVSFLLGASTLFYIVAGYPDRSSIDLRYEMEMSGLTPEALAREKSDPLNGLFGTPRKWTVSLEQLRAEAEQDYKTAISELPRKQLQHVMLGIAAWITASLSLLTVGWFIRRVICGFTSPNTVV